MTVQLRRRLYYVFFILATFSLAGAAWLAFDAGEAGFSAARHAAFADGESHLFVSGIFAVFTCAAFAAITLGVIAIKAGRTVSAEVFFFGLWCFGLAFESGRMAIVWLSANGAGLELLSNATRMVVFGRYLGSLALFMGSVYPLGFKQERISAMAGIAFVLALFFASIQPLNTGYMGQGFLVQRGYERLVAFFDGALLLASILNYLIAARTNGDRHFIQAALSLAAIAGGAVLLRNAPGIVLVSLGGTAMVAACLVYLRTLYGYYLWR